MAARQHLTGADHEPVILADAIAELVNLLTHATDTASEPALTWEDRHAAFIAGVEYGHTERARLDVDDRARQLLHDQALEQLGMARQQTATKGTAWAQMIQEAGDDDE